MLNQFERTELLLGPEAISVLNKAHVAIFGVGGVGGYVTEALVRSGIQHIDIIDNDTVSLSNLNRQIIATHSSIGKYKVDVMKDRILDINPEAEVNTFKCFYLPETKNIFEFKKYDYIVDAVDTVTAKLQLIMQAKEAGVKIISCMGTGNKLNPAMLEISDISKTSVCPLARVMRQECKKRKITNVKVLYSKEIPLRPLKSASDQKTGTRKDTPGSTAFVPSAAGLLIASEIVRELIAEELKKARQ